MSEIADMLAQLQGQGTFDSTGTFTLDVQKRQEKLAAYLLPEPACYILKLVQWAVGSEASRIKVEVTKDRVFFAHNGLSLEAETVLKWREHLHSDRQPRADLALALNTIMGLSPYKVQLSHRQAGRCYDVLFERQGDSIREFESDHLDWERLTVLEIDRSEFIIGSPLARQQFVFESARYAFSWGKKITSGLTNWAEIALLRNCCHHCPVPLKANGRYVNRPFFGLPCAHRKLDGLDCATSKVDQRYPNYETWYLPVLPEPTRLLAPSVHPGARKSTWLRAHEDKSHVVVEGANFRSPKPLKKFKRQHRLKVFASYPIAVSAMLLHHPKEILPKTGQARYVFRGVSIHTEPLKFLPNASYGVICGQDIETDMTGLVPTQSAKRKEALSTIAKHL